MKHEKGGQSLSQNQNQQYKEVPVLDNQESFQMDASQQIQQVNKKYDKTEVCESLKQQILKEMKKYFDDVQINAKRKNDLNIKNEQKVDLQSNDQVINQFAKIHEEIMWIIHNMPIAQAIKQDKQQKYMPVLQQCEKIVNIIVQQNFQFPFKINQKFQFQVQKTYNAFNEIKKVIAQLLQLRKGCCGFSGTKKYMDVFKYNYHVIDKMLMYFQELMQLDAREGFVEIHQAPVFSQESMSLVLSQLLTKSMPSEQMPQIQYIHKVKEVEVIKEKPAQIIERQVEVIKQVQIKDRLREAHEMYFGIGQSQNVKMAIDIYIEEAKKNNEFAYNALGQIYFERKHVQKNIAKALSYYQESAKLGNAEGWYRIGQFIELNLVQEKDVEVLQQEMQQRNSSNNKTLIATQKLDKDKQMPRLFTAMYCYQKAANQNHLDAITDLGFIYESGVLRNDGDQQYTYRQNDMLLCTKKELTQPSSQNSEMWLLAPDWKKAEEFYLRAVRLQFPRAMNNLGKFYLMKHDVNRESQPNNNTNNVKTAKPSINKDLEAMELIENAHNFGCAKATFNLGICYERGYVVAKDLTTAKRYFTLAASKGDLDAKSFFGIYLIKEAQEKDNDEMLYREAANQFLDIIRQDDTKGEPYFYLGFLYENGLGVSQDAHQAINYYRKAAEGSVPVAAALNRLGDYYISGELHSELVDNIQVAYDYYEKAARLNNKKALMNIATMLEEGSVDGCPNYNKALEYYKKAKRLGVPEAAFSIGLMYQNLKVTTGDQKKDEQKALVNFSLAAEKGLPAAEYMIKSKLDLDNEQMKNLQINNFLPTNYNTSVSQQQLQQQQGIDINQIKMLSKQIIDINEQLPSLSTFQISKDSQLISQKNQFKTAQGEMKDILNQVFNAYDQNADGFVSFLNIDGMLDEVAQRLKLKKPPKITVQNKISSLKTEMQQQMNIDEFSQFFQMLFRK